MITVYIASAYTKGDTAVNVRESLLVADKLVELGFLPFTPLLSHLWHLISPHPHEFWMKLDLAWIMHCDCVLRLPGESSGADAEVEFALRQNIPVFFNIDDLVAWYENDCD